MRVCLYVYMYICVYIIHDVAFSCTGLPPPSPRVQLRTPANGGGCAPALLCVYVDM